MKKLITAILILFFFIIIENLYSMDGYLFPSLTANLLEPRIGTTFELTAKKLRLDIGTSVDLIEFNTGEESKTRIGTDFFTLSRLRSEGNLKFPVETADYFFGVNSTTKGKAYGLDYSARLRLAHISSHIIDGLAKDSILSVKPFVYSREFAELTCAVNIDIFRLYAGLTYVFSRQPKSTNSLIPQLGFDSKYKINQYLNICTGYDLRLSGYEDKYFASHSALVGIELIISGDKGLLLYISSFKGKSIHGMFYKDEEEFTGLGFQVIY